MQYLMSIEKFSFHLPPSTRQSEGRLSYRPAVLELVRIQCLALGHFRRVDACYNRSLNLSPLVEVQPLYP